MNKSQLLTLAEEVLESDDSSVYESDRRFFAKELIQIYKKSHEDESAISAVHGYVDAQLDILVQDSSSSKERERIKRFMSYLVEKSENLGRKA